MRELLRRRRPDRPTLTEQDIWSIQGIVKKEIQEDCQIVFNIAPKDVQITVEPGQTKSTSLSARVLINLDIESWGNVIFPGWRGL